MAIGDSNQSPTSVAEIAANGNVILVVGPHKRRLQVSSVILMNASKYFRVMFGPHFSEGQDLGGDSPKEIAFPDDDANALEIICNILHLRNDVVPETLDPIEVLEVAVAADKFECIVAVKYASTLWLNPKEIQDIGGLGRLMAAAYKLDNVRAFSEITLAMMLRHNDSYLTLAEMDINLVDIGLVDIVPWKVLYMLEERRSLMRTELQQIIFNGARGAGTDDSKCSCMWSRVHASAYMERLHGQQLGPLQTLQTTISGVLKKLEKMRDPTTPQGWDPCEYRWHGNPDYTILRTWLDDFKKVNGNGLCIDCIRSSTAAAKQNCRIKHHQLTVVL